VPKPPWFPKQQAPNVQPTLLPRGEAVNFDPDAFDDAIRTQGLTFVHWRALKCPIGVVDADDERHPHGDHGDCSNGFLYRVVGPVTCVPSGNNNNPQVQDLGVVNQVNMQVTAPRFYDMLATDGSRMPVYLAPYDRMYLAEETITVVQWEEREACGGPTDKLDYPVVVVEELVDSLGRDLLPGADYTVRDGLLTWVPGGRQPVKNPEAGTGGIFSIRYRYRPYWYVKDLPHEIRVTNLEDPLTGIRRTERMQEQAILQREYVFENQANDPAAKDLQEEQAITPQPENSISKALGQSNLRHILAPRKGGFGPR
jgi:hypothetical protein